MMWRLSCAFIFFILKEGIGVTPPCEPTGHKRIPNLGQRYVNFVIHDSETPSHDRYLEETWYYVGNDPMPEDHPLELNSCGTKFPIWLNGTHPTDVEIPVNKTACEMDTFGACVRSYEIQIILCPLNFFLYYLVPTETTSEGYCFGLGNEGNGTDYLIPKPTVTSELISYAAMFGSYTRVRFICDFEAATSEDLFYQVTWYSNGYPQYTTTSEQVSNMDELKLTEDIFVEKGFQLGRNLSCRVRPFDVVGGPPGLPSPTSDDVFTGIKILTESLTFRKDETDEAKMTIRVQPTVPIGCQDGPCSISLNTYVPEDKFHKCTSLAISDCGVKIHNETFDSELQIKLSVADTIQYPTFKPDVYEVHMETSTAENKIWENYKLQKIVVTIEPSASSASASYAGKRCHSTGDPHLRTFDGRLYDNHQPGVFTMYEHVQFDTEVQIQHAHCNTYSGVEIMCTCGVAVKAGQDVYVINICDTSSWVIGYSNCGDNALSVTTTNEINYTIYFTYGTYIEVSIHGYYVNVRIQPSAHDEGSASRGLCGTLNGLCTDDFHDRNGDTGGGLENAACSVRLNYRQTPTTFVNIWNVGSDSDNLFSANLDPDHLQPWNVSVCVCTKSSNEGADVDNPIIPCNPNSVATCSQEKVIGTSSCTAVNSRRRRSVHRKPVIPNVRVPHPAAADMRHKREAVLKNWTEAEARTFCEEYMSRSQVFNLCGQVPNAEPESFVDTCTMDVMITGETDWASSTLDAMQGACLTELQRNTTLRESTGNTPSIAEIIENIACPGNCSSQGSCVNGTCMCDHPFGGSDCSLNMTKGPTISGILDNGLCDEQAMECDQAYVFGHPFTFSPNLTCRLEEFSMAEDGTRVSITTHFTPAEFETIIEVMCPLNVARKKRSAPTTGGHDEFVVGYTLSVTTCMPLCSQAV